MPGSLVSSFGEIGGFFGIHGRELAGCGSDQLDQLDPVVRQELGPVSGHQCVVFQTNPAPLGKIDPGFDSYHRAWR